MEYKTISEIKTYCRDNNIQGYSKYTRKVDLVNFVNTNVNTNINTNVNTNVNNQQLDYDYKLAMSILESEKSFQKQKQKEAYIKQKEEFLKQKKIKEDIIKQKQLEGQLLRNAQDQEYKKALEEDINNSEMAKYKEEKDKKYAEKISNDDHDKIRLARLARFNKFD